MATMVVEMSSNLPANHFVSIDVSFVIMKIAFEHNHKNKYHTNTHTHTTVYIAHNRHSVVQ